ncbi:Hypothetical protein D9617_7g031920 [Elsinoe fawcettii]|nr:Hypothetical protein D9617_7g031920 [Elsinoe fawcettii]
MVKDDLANTSQGLGMDLRIAAFQSLKPVCVGLNQAVLALQGRSQSPEQVLQQLRRLQSTLEGLPSDSLDSKLAEYVFVPLSNVLRSSQGLSLEAAEITYHCLVYLIRDGWREKIAGPLASQLIILLSITADGTRQRDSKVGSAFSSQTSSNGNVPATLLEAVFSCLEHLLNGLAKTERGRAQLLDPSTLPHLSHCVVVTLDGLVSSVENATQIAAGKVLQSLIHSLQHDHQALSNFLPGMVSSLTKVLTPTTQTRRSWRVLSNSLKNYRLLLIGTISNIAIVKAGITLPSATGATDLRAHGSQSSSVKDAVHSKEIDSKTASHKLDASWLRASAAQLKLALSNVNKLISHDRPEVRLSLFELDLTILRDCSETLPDCQQMCLESLTILSSDDRVANEPRSQLNEAIRSSSGLAKCLQGTVRDWTLSLPRILEGSDEDKKGRRLTQVFSAFNMLLDSGQDTRSIDSSLTSGLPDYVNSILSSTNKQQPSITELLAVRLEELPITLRTTASLKFSDVLAKSPHQSSLLRLVQQQLQHLADVEKLAPVAESSALLVRTTTGSLQTSAFYLALSSLRTTSDADAFFNLDNSPWREDALADLYDFSVSTLSDPVASDSSIALLSMETVAMQSIALGPSFCPELLDVLYPVLSFLASSDTRIRSHAITCLNIIAQSCEYGSVRDLVTENADYITNAIALKLNAFEVDPEAPQVLMMAVSLAGPSLVPHLGDTVDSIFAILDDYHGYERLVELLFGALRAIAKQGAQEPRLMIEGSKSKDSASGAWSWKPSKDITSLAQRLVERRAKRTSSFPGSPFTVLSPSLLLPTQLAFPIPPVRTQLTSQGLLPPSSPSAPSSPPTKPFSAPSPEPTLHNLESSSPTIPAPQTYPLILRIATLTQHYLPSPSPSLRKSLLSLLTEIAPSLAQHEDSFLPLINTLWPEVVSRLRDEEVSVVTAALGTIEVLAREARGFMSGRVRDVWPELLRVGRRVRKEVEGEETYTAMKKKGKGKGKEGQMGLSLSKRMEVGYVDSSIKALWEGLRRLMVTVVRDVGVQEDMFDDVVALLGPVEALREEERRVLEEVNLGAVWLARYRPDRSTLVVPERIRATRQMYRWAGVAA